MRKKAQSAVPAMIVLIAIFIILYTYLMPLSEKCKLMSDLPECQEISVEENRIIKRNLAEIKPETLIEEEIGFLPIQEQYTVYSIRPVKIINIEEIEIATIFEKESIMENWFTKDVKKGVFSIHEKSEGVRLFLYISKGSGTLKLNINSNAKFLIKEDDLEKDMPLEIYIPAKNLDDLNILRLSVSNPLTPFQKNIYEIEKIIVKETYRLTEDQVENRINIREGLNQLEKAYLDYSPHCLTNEKLAIKLNNYEIRNKVLCKEELIDITKEIKEDNKLIFSTKGNYFISPIKLHLKFEKGENTKFYFDIDNEEYENIRQGVALILLKLDFESTENKEVDVYINKNVLEINTKDIDYETIINRYIKEGENLLEISARTDTKVESLKVHIR